MQSLIKNFMYISKSVRTTPPPPPRGGGGGGDQPHDWLRTRVQKRVKLVCVQLQTSVSLTFFL